MSNIEKKTIDVWKKINLNNEIKKNIEKNNIEQKKNILIEFRCLIEKKVNLNELVKGIKVVRDYWNCVGDISPN